MVPKLIHYCWFGGNALDKLSLDCIETWRKYLPDYEIIEWNESKFDIDSSIYFVKQAYENKKWAFVSDYVRAYALFNYGGIYLDTDVEVKKSFDMFLANKAFSGFERRGYPFTAVWGTQKHHHWPKLVLDYYNDLQEFTIEPNTNIVSNILVDVYNVKKNEDRFQCIDNDICIYPSDTFCTDIPTNYACHHFNGSWLKNEKGEKDTLWKDQIILEYYENKYFDLLKKRKNIDYQTELLKNVDKKHLIKEILNRVKSKLLK